jgi:hypothetical protein
MPWERIRVLAPFRVTGQNFGDWLSTARDTREQVAARLDTVA